MNNKGREQATVRTRVYLSYGRCMVLSIRKCSPPGTEEKNVALLINSR